MKQNIKPKKKMEYILRNSIDGCGESLVNDLIFVTTQLSARIHHISQILYNPQNSTSYEKGYGEEYVRDMVNTQQEEEMAVEVVVLMHMLGVVMNDFMDVMIRGMHRNYGGCYDGCRKGGCGDSSGGSGDTEGRCGCSEGGCGGTKGGSGWSDGGYGYYDKDRGVFDVINTQKSIKI